MRTSCKGQGNAREFFVSSRSFLVDQGLNLLTQILVGQDDGMSPVISAWKENE